MIQTIEITIQNGPYSTFNAMIVYPKNICYINQKKYEVTDEFLKQVQSILCLWKEEYGSNGNIDSEEFTIIVKTTDKKDTFHGKGVFPHDYNYLKELLGDLHD